MSHRSSQAAGGAAGVRSDAIAIGLWREGAGLALDKQQHEFPDRCVMCNRPANGFRLKKTFYWHAGWIYLLIFAGVLIYVIAALILRKSVTVAVPLCARHKQRRMLGMLIGVGGFIGAMVGLFGMAAVGASGDAGFALLIICLLMLVVTPFVGVALSSTLRPTYIDDQVARFRAGRPFVEGVPARR